MWAWLTTRVRTQGRLLRQILRELQALQAEQKRLADALERDGLRLNRPKPRPDGWTPRRATRTDVLVITRQDRVREQREAHDKMRTAVRAQLERHTAEPDMEPTGSPKATT